MPLQPSKVLVQQTEEILAYGSRSLNPAKEHIQLQNLVDFSCGEMESVPGWMTFLFSNRSFFSPVDVQDNQTQYPNDLVGS